jgi:hypothetical protein
MIGVPLGTPTVWDQERLMALFKDQRARLAAEEARLKAEMEEQLGNRL